MGKMANILDWPQGVPSAENVLSICTAVDA